MLRAAYAKAALLFCFLLPYAIFAQTTIYKETIGTYSGTISVAAYTGWAHGNAYTHTVAAGTVVLNSSITASNYSGASGGTPVRVSGNSSWVISGINTSSCSNITLSFGVHKTNFQHNGTGMLVEVSGNGVNYTALTWTALSTGPGTGDSWYYRAGGTQVTGIIPTTTNLHIRFRNTSNDPYDFDDIELRATVVVPVKFKSITAKPHPAGQEIAWTTAEEQNVNYFEMQRSENGLLFTAAGRVDAGNRSGESRYALLDRQCISAKTFYRVVSVDHDGRRTYSATVAVDPPQKKQAFAVAVVHGSRVELYCKNRADRSYQYQVIGEGGRLVQQGTVSSVYDKIRIDVPRAAPGLYFLVLSNRTETHSIKLLLGR